MTIQFLCPNGHSIRCPEEKAGRAAKCPKCGVRFRIPALEEIQAGLDEEDGDDARADSGQSVAEEQIEFLCPNGHRLNGPASLQGRPGQCPECGCKFRVPSYDDVPDESEEPTDQSQIGVGALAGESESDVKLETPDGPSEEQGEEPVELRSGDGAGRGLASLFPQLWAQRGQGAIVELHFADGQSLIPVRFAPASAQRSHGLFALQEDDGKFSLLAVAWSAINRVVVRKVGALPPELGGQ